MNKYKSKINLLYTLVFMALSLINLIISIFGYDYRPYSYFLYMIIFISAEISMTVLSVRNRRNWISDKSSVIFGRVLPLISILYTVTVWHAIDLRTSFININYGFFMFIGYISFLCPFIIFIISFKGKNLKSFIIVSFAIISIPYLMITNLAIIMGKTESYEELKTLESDNGIYVMQVINFSDNLKECKYINVRKNDIELLTGRLISRRVNVWSGEQEKMPKVSWADNHNILINGEKYNAGYFINSKEKKFHIELKVYVPDRKADFEKGDYGGFPRDGTYIEKYILTGKEIQYEEEDILKNPNWKKIDPDCDKAIYGRYDESFYTGGLTHGKIPLVENGYYCYFNKNTGSSVLTDSIDCYYNYFIGIYSPDKHKLYIYESDT